MPRQPIADRQAGTWTPGPCRVGPNRCTCAEPLQQARKKRPTRLPAREARSSSLHQTLLGQQLELRFELIDALGEIVDQLTLGVGKSAVLKIPDVDTRSNHAPRNTDHR